MRDLFGVLIRHFFGRFFDNELVSRQSEMTSSFAKIIGALAAPGLIAFWLLPKYAYYAFEPAKAAEAASLIDKLFFLTFSMVVMGFVTVLEWDALFPDRRDFTILIPLPIPLPSIFAAKITSLCAFVLVFFAATNAFSTFLYPFVSSRGESTFLGTMNVMFTHATCLLAGTSFMFFFFVALQGILMNVLSFRTFQRVSTYIQLISVFVLLMMLLLFLDSNALLENPAHRHFLYYFPPMWFLGLYETMVGWPDPLSGSREIGLRALAAVMSLSAIAYALCYKRHVKRSLESEEIFDVVPGKISTLLCSLADRLIVRRPLEQASFYFTGKTMFRSRKHWLYLAAYVGVGFALVLQGLVGAFSRAKPPSIDTPAASFLSIPLVLSFFLLSGMRVIFTMPAELKANWVFQLSEAAGRKECLAGVRKAMFIFGALPLFVSLFPVYVFLWGWAAACFHTFFDIVLALLLIELLLLNFHKIPFTCSYLAGKANITTRWFVYWLGFAIYAYTMASVEAWALQNGIRITAFYFLGVALVAAAFYYRDRMLDEEFNLVFEDEPDPVVRKLNLSVPGANWP